MINMKFLLVNVQNQGQEHMENYLVIVNGVGIVGSIDSPKIE
jgi:hypothetical protein